MFVVVITNRKQVSVIIKYFSVTVWLFFGIIGIRRRTVNSQTRVLFRSRRLRFGLTGVHVLISSAAHIFVVTITNSSQVSVLIK